MTINKKTLKRMRYTSDQEGIMNRYLRESANWDKHLKNTRKFILNRIKKQHFNSIAFLGSGWLLDVPLNELLEMNKTVFLYDIRHPRQIKHKLKEYNTVILHEIDLTGGLIEKFYQVVKNNSAGDITSPIEELSANCKLPEIKGDIVVSLNIMDQLDGLLIEFLKSEIALENKFWLKIRKQIQKNHLRLLEMHRSLLIADVEELISDKNGTITNPLLFAKMPHGKYRENWKWVFDTTGSYHKNKKTVFNVVGIEL
jgi:hypothetical protein